MKTTLNNNDVIRLKSYRPNKDAPEFFRSSTLDIRLNDISDAELKAAERLIKSLRLAPSSTATLNYIEKFQKALKFRTKPNAASKDDRFILKVCATDVFTIRNRPHIESPKNIKYEFELRTDKDGFEAITALVDNLRRKIPPQKFSGMHL